MTPSDEAFEAFLAASDRTSDPDLAAKRAWDAALEYAARQAREAQKRYTCNKMRGVCRGIADAIRKGGGK